MSAVKPWPLGGGYWQDGYLGGHPPASVPAINKREFRLAPESAMPASGMAGQYWRKSVAEPAAKIREVFVSVGQRFFVLVR
jgi:hypothetical protein